MPNVTPASVVAFADAPVAPLPLWPGQRVWRVVARDGAARLAVGVLLLFVVAAVGAPWLAPHDPFVILDMSAGRQPPSAAHWFGTDPAGRDLFSRVLHGARLSLGIATSAVTLSMLVGTAWGAVAGFGSRLVDVWLMRFVDAGLATPRIILLLAIASFWGSLTPLALAAVLGLTGWFGAGRLVRDEVRSIRTRDFVQAARALGLPRARILVRHVLPHALTPVLVAATLGIGQVVVLEAGLAFLGYGMAPPTASWGSIIRDGREVMTTAWWMSVFPGIALALTVLSINVLGDRLRAALSARQLPAP